LRPAADSTLFDRWLDRRDGDAFAELARRHAPVAYDLARRTLGDGQAAEDMVQEALLDLALERTRKPVEVGIAAWLVRFAVCRAKNRRVSESSRSRRERTVGQRRPEVVMPDNSVELADELENVLAHAQDEERLILAMRYLHDWDYARIAASLEISEGAARVRVHRALAGVRERLVATRPGAEPRVTAALAALPVFTLPSSRLEGTIANVLADARAELGVSSTGVGTQPAAWSRVARLALELAALLAVLGAGGATAASSARPGAHSTDEARMDRESALIDDASAAAAEPRTPRDALDASGSPRPRGWDDGALRRIARDERELRTRESAPSDRSGRHTASGPEIGAGIAPLLGTDRNPTGLSSTSRPTTREACAARCDTASSEGERAGVIGSPSVAVWSGSASAAATAAPAATSDAPTSSPAPARPEAAARRLADRPSRLVDALPAEQRAVFVDAALAVERVVGGELGDLARLGDDRDAWLRARRRAAREYRHLRRELRSAAIAGDSGRVAVVAKAAYKISTLNQVLDLLVEALRARPASFGEVRWPDGLDVTRALEDLLLVFGTFESASDAAPGGGPDAAPHHPSVPEALDPDRLPDGLDQ
jgi:RNA polymerase sigma-70 factor (ECF subfamily)